MRILFTGDLPDSIFDIIQPLREHKNKITLVSGSLTSDDGEQNGHMREGVKIYSMLPTHIEFEQVLRGSRFDAAVFFLSCQCEPIGDDSIGTQYDMMQRMLRFCERYRIDRFILVTDQRVFGASQIMAENTEPEPDTFAGSVMRVAEKHLLSVKNINSLIIRVTSVFSQGAADSFFELATKSGSTVRFSGSPDTPCDFLHANDMGVFLRLAIAENIRGVVHLAFGSKCTYRQVADWMIKQRAELKFVFGDVPLRFETLRTGRATQDYDWIPVGSFADTITLNQQTKRRLSVWERAREFLRKTFDKALPIAEMLIGAAVMEMFVISTQTSAMFRIIDFRLLFTVLMGNTHGVVFGLAAGVLAYISYAFDFVTQGGVFSELLYNMDNWLAFVLYMFCGTFIGYTHDRHVLKQTYLEDENEKNAEMLRYVDQVYQDTCEIRDELYEQVTHSRDSYGRIYTIARELDELHPDAVFFKALSALESILENHSVAIYVQQANSHFARLSVKSRELGEIGNSLDLNTLPELAENIQTRTIFANDRLLEGYPVYCAPLRVTESDNMLVFIWNADASQQTLFYKNLFVVVTGLVSSSLAHAQIYIQSTPGRYIQGTEMLSDVFFRETLGVRKSMQDERVAQFLLLRVYPADGVTNDDAHISGMIARCTRATDTQGKTDDGNCYVIISQASEESLPLIKGRFEKNGLACEMVKMSELL